MVGGPKEIQGLGGGKGRQEEDDIGDEPSNMAQVPGSLNEIAKSDSRATSIGDAYSEPFNLTS